MPGNTRIFLTGEPSRSNNRSSALRWTTQSASPANTSVGTRIAPASAIKRVEAS